MSNNINIKVSAIGNFSQLESEIAKLQKTISLVQAKPFLGSSGDEAVANIKKVQNRFDQMVAATRAFNVQIVKSADHIDDLGTRLERGKLKLHDYYQLWSQRNKGVSTELGQLVDQQARLSKSFFVPDALRSGWSKAITNLTADLKTLGAEQDAVVIRAKVMNSVVRGLGTELINLGKNTQWTGRQLTVGLTVPLASFAAMAAKQFREVNAELTKMQRMYGTGIIPPSHAEIDRVSKQVMELSSTVAKNMGIAQSETVKAAAEFSAVGLMGDKLINATEQAMRLSKLGAVNAETAQRTIVSLQTVFRVGNKDLKESVDFLNDIQKQTSTDIQDLTDAIPRVGPIIQQLGGTYKDAAVMMVAMKEAGIPAAQSANAIKSAVASIIGPTKQATDEFAKFGISLTGLRKDTEGNPIKMIEGLQQALQKLDPLTQAQLVEKLFGKFQFARVTALLNNLGRAGSQTQNAFMVANASAKQLAQLADQELKVATESVTARYEKALQGFKASLMPIGEAATKVATMFLNAFSKVADFFNKLGPLKNIISGALGGAAIVGPVLMLTGLMGNLIGSMIKGFNTFRMFKEGFANGGGIMGGLQGIQNYFEKIDLSSLAAAQNTDKLADNAELAKQAFVTLNREVQLLESRLRDIAIHSSKKIAPTSYANMTQEELTRLSLYESARKQQGGERPHYTSKAEAYNQYLSDPTAHPELQKMEAFYIGESGERKGRERFRRYFEEGQMAQYTMVPEGSAAGLLQRRYGQAPVIYGAKSGQTKEEVFSRETQRLLDIHDEIINGKITGEQRAAEELRRILGDTSVKGKALQSGQIEALQKIVAQVTFAEEQVAQNVVENLTKQKALLLSSESSIVELNKEIQRIMTTGDAESRPARVAAAWQVFTESLSRNAIAEIQRFQTVISAEMLSASDPAQMLMIARNREAELGRLAIEAGGAKKLAMGPGETMGAQRIKSSIVGYGSDITKRIGFQTGGSAWVPGYGTGDKVPAMLEPGEFVVNRNAAKQYGGMLEDINFNRAPRFMLGGYTDRSGKKLTSKDMESIPTEIKLNMLKYAPKRFMQELGMRPRDNREDATWELKGSSGIFIGDINNASITSINKALDGNGVNPRDFIKAALTGSRGQNPGEPVRIRGTHSVFLKSLLENGNISQQEYDLRLREFDRKYISELLAMESAGIKLTDKNNPLARIQKEIISSLGVQDAISAFEQFTEQSVNITAKNRKAGKKASGGGSTSATIADVLIGSKIMQIPGLSGSKRQGTLFAHGLNTGWLNNILALQKGGGVPGYEIGGFIDKIQAVADEWGSTGHFYSGKFKDALMPLDVFSKLSKEEQEQYLSFLGKVSNGKTTISLTGMGIGTEHHRAWRSQTYIPPAAPKLSPNYHPGGGEKYVMNPYTGNMEYIPESIDPFTGQPAGYYGPRPWKDYMVAQPSRKGRRGKTAQFMFASFEQAKKWANSPEQNPEGFPYDYYWGRHTMFGRKVNDPVQQALEYWVGGSQRGLGSSPIRSNLISAAKSLLGLMGSLSGQDLVRATWARYGYKNINNVRTPIPSQFGPGQEEKLVDMIQSGNFLGLSGMPLDIAGMTSWADASTLRDKYSSKSLYARLKGFLLSAGWGGEKAIARKLKGEYLGNEVPLLLRLLTAGKTQGLGIEGLVKEPSYMGQPLDLELMLTKEHILKNPKVSIDSISSDLQSKLLQLNLVERQKGGGIQKLITGGYKTPFEQIIGKRAQRMGAEKNIEFDPITPEDILNSPLYHGDKTGTLPLELSARGAVPNNWFKADFFTTTNKAIADQYSGAGVKMVSNIPDQQRKLINLLEGGPSIMTQSSSLFKSIYRNFMRGARNNFKIQDPRAVAFNNDYEIALRNAAWNTAYGEGTISSEIKRLKKIHQGAAEKVTSNGLSLIEFNRAYRKYGSSEEIPLTSKNPVEQIALDSIRAQREWSKLLNMGQKLEKKYRSGDYEGAPEDFVKKLNELKSKKAPHKFYNTYADGFVYQEGMIGRHGKPAIGDRRTQIFENNDVLRKSLLENGYTGLVHTGGLATHGQQHNVAAWFDPTGIKNNALQKGGIPGFATGGSPWVPGSGNGDRVPAMLEPGEFVVNKNAAKQYGGLLNHLNWNVAPRFAQGSGKREVDPRVTVAQVQSTINEFSRLFPSRIISQATTDLHGGFAQIFSRLKTGADGFETHVKNIGTTVKYFGKETKTDVFDVFKRALSSVKDFEKNIKEAGVKAKTIFSKEGGSSGGGFFGFFGGGKDSKPEKQKGDTHTPGSAYVQAFQGLQASLGLAGGAGEDDLEGGSKKGKLGKLGANPMVGIAMQMIAPMLAEPLKKAAGDNKLAQGAIGMGQAGLQIGSMFGPWGALIGTGVGAIGGAMKSWFDEQKRKAQDTAAGISSSTRLSSTALDALGIKLKGFSGATVLTTNKLETSAQKMQKSIDAVAEALKGASDTETVNAIKNISDALKDKDISKVSGLMQNLYRTTLATTGSKTKAETAVRGYLKAAGASETDTGAVLGTLPTKEKAETLLSNIIKSGKGTGSDIGQLLSQVTQGSEGLSKFSSQLNNLSSKGISIESYDTFKSFNDTVRATNPALAKANSLLWSTGTSMKNIVSIDSLMNNGLKLTSNQMLVLGQNTSVVNGLMDVFAKKQQLASSVSDLAEKGKAEYAARQAKRQAALEKEIKTSQSLIAKDQRVIESYNKKIKVQDDLIYSYNQRIKGYQKESSAIDKSINNIQKEIDARQKLYDKNQQAIQQEQTLADLRAEITRASASGDILAQAAAQDKYNKEIERQNALRAKESKDTADQARIDSLKNRQDELNQKIESTQNLIEGCEKKQRIYNKAVEDAQSEIDTQNKKITTAQTEIDGMNTAAEKFNTTLDGAGDKIAAWYADPKNKKKGIKDLVDFINDPSNGLKGALSETKDGIKGWATQMDTTYNSPAFKDFRTMLQAVGNLKIGNDLFKQQFAMGYYMQHPSGEGFEEAYKNASKAAGFKPSRQKAKEGLVVEEDGVTYVYKDGQWQIKTVATAITTSPGGGVRKITYTPTNHIPKDENGRPYLRAQGGYIRGPGDSTSDSIPARLSNGEYVVKASSVAKYGTSFLDGINEQKFASGGLAGFKDGGIVNIKKWIESSKNYYGKQEDYKFTNMDRLVAQHWQELGKGYQTLYQYRTNNTIEALQKKYGGEFLYGMLPHKYINQILAVNNKKPIVPGNFSTNKWYSSDNTPGGDHVFADSTSLFHETGHLLDKRLLGFNKFLSGKIKSWNGLRPGQDEEVRAEIWAGAIARLANTLPSHYHLSKARMKKLSNSKLNIWDPTFNNYDNRLLGLMNILDRHGSPMQNMIAESKGYADPAGYLRWLGLKVPKSIQKNFGLIPGMNANLGSTSQPGKIMAPGENWGWEGVPRFDLGGFVGRLFGHKEKKKDKKKEKKKPGYGSWWSAIMDSSDRDKRKGFWGSGVLHDVVNPFVQIGRGAGYQTEKGLRNAFAGVQNMGINMTAGITGHSVKSNIKGSKNSLFKNNPYATKSGGFNAKNFAGDVALAGINFVPMGFVAKPLKTILKPVTKPALKIAKTGLGWAGKGLSSAAKGLKKSALQYKDIFGNAKKSFNYGLNNLDASLSDLTSAALSGERVYRGDFIPKTIESFATKFAKIRDIKDDFGDYDYWHILTKDMENVKPGEKILKTIHSILNPKQFGNFAKNIYSKAGNTGLNVNKLKTLFGEKKSDAIFNLENLGHGMLYGLRNPSFNIKNIINRLFSRKISFKDNVANTKIINKLSESLGGLNNDGISGVFDEFDPNTGKNITSYIKQLFTEYRYRSDVGEFYKKEDIIGMGTESFLNQFIRGLSGPESAINQVLRRTEFDGAIHNVLSSPFEELSAIPLPSDLASLKNPIARQLIRRHLETVLTGNWDLHQKNIMFSSEGIPKIVDSGLNLFSKESVANDINSLLPPTPLGIHDNRGYLNDLLAEAEKTIGKKNFDKMLKSEIYRISRRTNKKIILDAFKRSTLKDKNLANELNLFSEENFGEDFVTAITKIMKSRVKQLPDYYHELQGYAGHSRIKPSDIRVFRPTIDTFAAEIPGYKPSKELLEMMKNSRLTTFEKLKGKFGSISKKIFPRLDPKLKDWMESGLYHGNFSGNAPDYFKPDPKMASKINYFGGKFFSTLDPNKAAKWAPEGTGLHYITRLSRRTKALDLTDENSISLADQNLKLYNYLISQKDLNFGKNPYWMKAEGPGGKPGFDRSQYFEGIDMGPILKKFGYNALMHTDGHKALSAGMGGEDALFDVLIQYATKGTELQRTTAPKRTRLDRMIWDRIFGKPITVNAAEPDQLKNINTYLQHLRKTKSQESLMIFSQGEFPEAKIFTDFGKMLQDYSGVRGVTSSSIYNELSLLYSTDPEAARLAPMMLFMQHLLNDGDLTASADLTNYSAKMVMKLAKKFPQIIGASIKEQPALNKYDRALGMEDAKKYPWVAELEPSGWLSDFDVEGLLDTKFIARWRKRFKTEIEAKTAFKKYLDEFYEGFVDSQKFRNSAFFGWSGSNSVPSKLRNFANNTVGDTLDSYILHQTGIDLLSEFTKNSLKNEKLPGMVESLSILKKLMKHSTKVSDMDFLGLMKKANGGYISGPGTGTSDSIPARLSNGEYVIKADAVSQYGTSFLDSINNQKFAKGGLASLKKFNVPSIGTNYSIGGNANNNNSSFNDNSVYNINISVDTNASPDDIANAVMTKIQRQQASMKTGRTMGGVTR